MPIPQAPDTVFALDPLEFETCQVSFPVVAKIDSVQPLDFYKLVQKQYPQYSPRPPGATSQPMPNIPRIVIEEPSSKSQSWQFVSADTRWTLRLAKGFLTLTLRGADAWAELRDRFKDAVAALVQAYHPALFNHVCVRQRYIVRPSMLGLGGKALGEVVRPWVFGPLTDPDLAPELGEAHCRYIFKLDKMEILETSFVLTEELPFREKVVVLDTHSFTNARTAQPVIPTTLDRLYGRSRDLFRAGLQRNLHDALTAGGTGGDGGAGGVGGDGAP